MTDFDIDYPPSRTYQLSAALDEAKRRVNRLDERIDELEADDEATDQALAEARQERSNAAKQRDALSWAIDEFGADAELTLEAFTANSRARVLDTLQRATVGQVGSEQARNWLIAGSITDAPWLEGGENLRERAEIADAVPPALLDWLDDELEDLNELTEGN